LRAWEPAAKCIFRRWPTGVIHRPGGFGTADLKPVSVGHLFIYYAGVLGQPIQRPCCWFSAALAIVLLAENARIPVDDPNTHLELTMIHEVMVLDNSGPDFAFILYGSALKLWLYAALLVGTVLPLGTLPPAAAVAVSAAAVFLTAVFIGVVESSMARLRLLRVPHLLFTAAALAILALCLH
jgi:formate hydrogenlyase subunit 4